MNYGGSSRYENFLQQETLVGSIVLGLLGHRTEDGAAAILPSTLDRILVDLERARSARQWLHDTRKVVETAQIKGAARRQSDSTGVQRDVRVPERRPSTRPSLVLRQTRTDEWTPIVEIPDFNNYPSINSVKSIVSFKLLSRPWPPGKHPVSTDQQSFEGFLAVTNDPKIRSARSRVPMQFCLRQPRRRAANC